ncbi:MAG: restriction endonuclease subunit S [Sphaerochaetaceae bacterium]
MREMKDSGIEWIGKIPQDWRVCRFKNTCSLFTGNSIKDEGKNKFEDKTNAHPYISTKDIDAASCIANYDNGLYVKNNDSSFKIALQNSTLMCIEGGSAGKKKTIVNQDVAFVNKLCCFHSISANNKYIYYFLNSPNYENKFKNNISGLIGGVSVSTLKNISMLLPPLPTQHHIADYLDTKCSKIDAIISNEKAVIEKLKEYKQSVITEIVTKGLNPDVKMKYSGVEWIGKIPEEWNITKFKTVFNYAKGLPITKADLLEKGIAVISYGQIHSKKNNGLHVIDELIRYVSKDYLQSNPSSIANFGDILFADTSEDYLGIGNCIYNDCKNNVFAGYHTIITRPIDDRIFSKYQAFLFKSDVWRSQIRSLANGIKVYSITQKMLNRVSIILPPLEEQKKITNHLDHKCSKIDSAIEKKQAVIDKLTEYKKSLIYEVVTGKKEI